MSNTVLTAFVPETGEIVGNFVPQENEDNGRAKGNKDFVMMYRRFIGQIADLGTEDPQALRVLLFLVRHMDTKNALAAPMALISDMLGLSRQTVSAKIKFLSDNGWISIYKLGRQNVYIVNPDVVWTAYGDQKSYCKFDAKVMLSGEDNWKLNKKQDSIGLRHIDRGVLKSLAEQEFPEEE